jgi:predicted Co/Zn/Cd cation transporter (cation efflux family)
MEWERALNAKLVRYETVSWTGIGNILAILLIAFLLSILVERGFYR